MTEPESNPPELSPAEEDAVRRQLAAARHTEPMPDAVVERLDRVLVGLAEERQPKPTVPPVIDLAARRRRLGVKLLVAAAAVVVAGVGISKLPSMSSNDSGGDAVSSADRGEAAMEGEADTGSDNPASEPTPRDPERVSEDEAHSLPVIRPDHFSADVAKPRQRTGYVRMDTETFSELKTARAACPVAAKGQRTLVVSYAGALAKLVYHAPTDDGQRVDLYRCDLRDRTSGYVRSVVLPGP